MAHPELNFRELLRDELVAVVPAGHALTKMRQRATWEELAKQSLVLLPRQSITRNLSERGFAAAGINAEPAYEVANMVTALGMVRAGLGITFMPSMVLRELNMKNLKAVSLTHPAPERVIGIIRRIDRPLSPASHAFIELLFDETREWKISGTAQSVAGKRGKSRAD
jgi:DNA-binding transcriptional LysR family regulator